MIGKEKPYFNLLDDCFPGIKANIFRCDVLGFPWSNIHFVKEDKGEVVSHVGLMEYPLLIEGKLHTVAALHAICTKASHRRKGLASELIQEALAWAKTRYEYVLLFTEIPEFYEKLSFRYIQESRFHLAYKRPKGSKPIQPVISPQDDALFRNSFHAQAPLSQRLWVKEDGAIHAFNALFGTSPIYWSVYYCPAFHGLISFFLEDKTLHLFDIVASTMPSKIIILTTEITEHTEI